MRRKRGDGSGDAAVKYEDLIRFDPIEAVVQIRDAGEAEPTKVRVGLE